MLKVQDFLSFLSKDCGLKPSPWVYKIAKKGKKYYASFPLFLDYFSVNFVTRLYTSWEAQYTPITNATPISRVWG